MRKILFLLLVSSLALATQAQTAADKEAVNGVVNSFSNSWKNHSFLDMGSYTTKDVCFINPVGMWWKGRDDVQNAFQIMHQSFMKTTLLTEESRDVRFIAPDVAVVTIITKSDAFYPPDGVDNGHNKRGGDRGFSTMTIVKQGSKWLLSSGQATAIDEKEASGNPIKQ